MYNDKNTLSPTRVSSWGQEGMYQAFQPFKTDTLAFVKVFIAY